MSLKQRGALVDYPELRKFMQSTTIAGYIQISLCTMLIFDTLITMDKEVEYFWPRTTRKRQRSLTSILFFVNRYIGILDAIAKYVLISHDVTTALCQTALWGGTIGDIFIDIIIEYILVLRVLVLWQRNKALTIILYSLIICELVAKFVLVVMHNIDEPMAAYTFSEGVTTCSFYVHDIELTNLYLLIDWISTAVFGFILILLALYKAIEDRKVPGLQGSSVINIMIKDQVSYYTLILFCFAMNVTHTLISHDSDGVRQAIFSLFGNSAFLCQVGSRMFINLVEVAKPRTDRITNDSSRIRMDGSTSIPQFAGRGRVGSCPDPEAAVRSGDYSDTINVSDTR